MGVHVVEVHRVEVVGGGGAVVVRLPAVAEPGVVVEQDLVAKDVLPAEAEIDHRVGEVQAVRITFVGLRVLVEDDLRSQVLSVERVGEAQPFHDLLLGPDEFDTRLHDVPAPFADRRRNARTDITQLELQVGFVLPFALVPDHIVVEQRREKIDLEGRLSIFHEKLLRHFVAVVHHHQSRAALEHDLLHFVLVDLHYRRALRVADPVLDLRRAHVEHFRAQGVVVGADDQVLGGRYKPAQQQHSRKKEAKDA